MYADIEEDHVLPGRSYIPVEEGERSFCPSADFNGIGLVVEDALPPEAGPIYLAH
jgi:hypothetical protein